MKSRRKFLTYGFTLIELLAVIVILAIIALIASPTIVGIIEEARQNALDGDAAGIYRATTYKLLEDKEFDVSILNRNNLESELEINSGNYDAVGVENNNGRITVTVLKDEMVSTFSNDESMVDSKVYGLSWDGEDTFTRINDAIGLTAAVGTGSNTVINDFDEAEIYNEMEEVVDEYGNQFIKIPKFYIKKTINGDDWIWQVSKSKKDDNYYLPSCFVDENNGKILPYILVGKYNASLNGSKLESKTGTLILGSRTITQFRDLARANGDEYQLLDIHVIDILQTLFYIEFGTIDSSSIMSGYAAGRYNDTTIVSSIVGNTITLTNSGSEFRVGQMIDVGTSLGGGQIAKYLRITAVSGNNITYEVVPGISSTPGTISANHIVCNVAYINGSTDDVISSSGSMVSNSDSKYAMKYRGIENLYGNIRQFVDGINIQDYQAYVARDASLYAVDNFNDGYVKVGYVNNTTSDYVIRMGYDKNNPFIHLATSVGIISDSRYKDGYEPGNGNRIAAFGGGWNFGNSVGISSWDLYSTSAMSSFRIGTRLVKIPLEW